VSFSSDSSNVLTSSNTISDNSPLPPNDEILSSEPDVPSLFETNKSSRWAYWQGYNQELPNGNEICVPLAMAQIIKYYKFPTQGINNNSYLWNNQLLSIDFSNQWYNYNNMPFRLTYCAKGTETCNDNSWEIIPGTTDEQISEISRYISLWCIS